MKSPPSKICVKLLDEVHGNRSWSFSEDFRIGRAERADLLLADISVSRQHAEIFWNGRNWQIRDLDSRNGTFVNHVQVKSPQTLSNGDHLEIGSVSLYIEIRPLSAASHPAPPPEEPPAVIETLAHASLERVLTELACDKKDKSGAEEKILALLRAGFHLGNHQSEEELIEAILDEAMKVLDAQRGAVVLLDDMGDLHLRAVKKANGGKPTGFHFSRHMARCCLREGTSILCSQSNLDRELKTATSVLGGQMSSILCVLLRTPRKRLGILHLDRNLTKEAFTHDDLQLADALAASVSAGLESAQLLRQQQEWFLETLTTLAQAVELRDPYTAGHAQRVTRYSMMLGRHMQLDSTDLHWLEIGTPLHDIGKIGIDDAILRKPTHLTDDEFEIMKSHPVKGEEMLRNLVKLFPILPIVRSHHERWDGRGYPDNLAGEEIPLLARVVAVADTFDAITTDRPYRKGLSFATATEEIHRGSGTQFDPRCAEAFFEIRHQLEEAASQAGMQVSGQKLPSSLKETRSRLPILSHLTTVRTA